MDQIEFEKAQYLSDRWFDGVEWKSVDIKYIDPGESVRKEFRKLYKVKIYFEGRNSLQEDDWLFLKSFLAHKGVEVTDWHHKSFTYWLSHKKLVVSDVFYKDKVVAIEIDINYDSFVVSQMCMPVDFDVYYKCRMGHRIALYLPEYFGKRVYIGYGDAYNYVRRSGN